MATLPFTNVGVFGGDLVTRRIALVLFLVLTVVAVPWLGFSHGALKIAALLGAMTGTLFLMAALVFLQNTHYAGVVLIPGPLVMVWFSSLGWRWVAVVFGVLCIVGSVHNLITRRCGFNKLLGINSCSCDT